MASEMTNEAKYQLGKGTIDLSSDNIVVVLLTSAHTPLPTNDTYADIKGDEHATGGNYTKGTGVNLSGASWSKDAGNNRAYLDGTDTVYSNVTLTNVRYAAYVIGTASLGDSDVVLCVCDLQATYSPSSVDLTVQHDSDGICELRRTT